MPGEIVNQQPDGQGSTTGGTMATVANISAILGQFNIAIPIVFMAYRAIRDLVKSNGGNDEGLTDQQLIALMQEPADRIVARANEFIAANKPPTP